MMICQRRLVGLLLILLIGLIGDESRLIAQGTHIATVADIVKLEAPPPDARIQYGQEGLQFGYLRLPEGEGPFPVVVLIHGGCWLAQFDLEHIGSAAAALSEAGYATWTIEYRRVGDEGGGWPGTFQDVAQGTDYLRQLTSDYPLDLSRVVVMGHSAGGHLALWVAARPRIKRSSKIHSENPLALQGVVALGSVPELEMAYQDKSCNWAMNELLGGSPEAYPERYAAASPANLFPLGIPQILINGKHDLSWFRFGEAYAGRARQAGEDIRFVVAPEAGHFEVILPSSSTWPLILQALSSLVDVNS